MYVNTPSLRDECHHMQGRRLETRDAGVVDLQLWRRLPLFPPATNWPQPRLHGYCVESICMQALTFLQVFSVHTDSLSNTSSNAVYLSPQFGSQCSAISHPQSVDNEHLVRLLNPRIFPQHSSLVSPLSPPTSNQYGLCIDTGQDYRVPDDPDPGAQTQYCRQRRPSAAITPFRL
jgi:hypothetical protein